MDRIDIKSLKKRTERGALIGGTLSRDRREFIIQNQISITKLLEWAVDRVENQLKAKDYKDGKITEQE